MLPIAVSSNEKCVHAYELLRVKNVSAMNRISLTFMALDRNVSNKHGQSITKNVNLNAFCVYCRYPLKSAKDITCDLTGICYLYDVIILAPIATIFIYPTDARLLNLTALKGASARYVTFSSLHGSLQSLHGKALIRQWAQKR